MLDFAAWVLVGALLGWLAGLVTHTGTLNIRLLNIVVGVVGAFLSALILTPLFGVALPREGMFSLPALVAALFGAIGLLLVVNPSRRSSPAYED